MQYLDPSRGTPTSGRRRWCAVGAPAQGTRALAAAAAVLAVAACGGAGTTTTAGPATGSGTAAAPTATPSLSPSASASPTPAPVPSTTTSATATTTATPSDTGGPRIELLWAVQTSSGTQIRRAALPGGGTAAVITTLAPNEIPIAIGHGRIVVSGPGGALRLIRTSDGSSSPLGGYSGNQPFGGAMSPDGAMVAFIDGGPTGGKLKVVNLISGVVSTVATFGTGPVPLPSEWSVDGIGAVDIVPSSDAGPQGVARLNPSSGAVAAHTTTTGAGGDVVTSDALHGFAVVHSSLGDDADAAPGPGPQGPFNTLHSIVIGSAPVALLKEAHHTISVLASLPGGDRVLIWDNSAAGGYAGIGLSPDFGLIVVSGGTKTQYRPYDSTQYDSGAFYQDGSTVAVASHDAGGEKLIQYAPGAAPVTLDSVAGGQSAQVALVPAS